LSPGHLEPKPSILPDVLPLLSSKLPFFLVYKCEDYDSIHLYTEKKPMPLVKKQPMLPNAKTTSHLPKSRILRALGY